jgi:hypothetical protein
VTTTPTPTTRRKNLYRGSMTSTDAEQKLTRIAQRLGLTGVKVSTGGAKSAARVGFTFGTTRVERTCATQPTYGANLVCLVLWLEDRARNMERGIETFVEAFADSLTLAMVGGAPPDEPQARHKSLYTGQKSLEQSIAVFRSTLQRLGVAEADVKLTWNADENWARLRMRLPSGSIVEKLSRVQANHTANVAALALWLQARTKNWERGIESMDLDRVFAGNLLPAKVA